MLAFFGIMHFLANEAAAFALFLWISSAFAVIFISLILWRKARKSRKRNWGPAARLKTCLVLGSGGHTTELLRLVEALGPQYHHRVYVMATTDKMSKQKVTECEERKRGRGLFEVHEIPRSREVRQSYLTSVYTTLVSVLSCFPLVLKIKPDLILCNGPGTCIPVCLVGFLMDLVRMHDCDVVFVESLARVKALSLSGEILYWTGMADRILVQWKEQKIKYPAVEYIGRF